MSVKNRIISLSVILAGIAIPVLAATDEREPPGELAVRIFLGFCALIIVAQLLPLARQVWRRLSEHKARRVEVTEDSPEN